ncbi:putative transcription factor AP2-EREBP family [Lupinus albus]|uniref:Putative transcription factor AP2-EREBP family n=1 Tax=Lupinus albus TaxID=3870 RepID=A0A6A4P0P2_LUPAL|nr:putative transcription factor AP2-EREBP family [Lupinus albus]
MDDSFNWLSSIPLSPINSSLPPYLQESKAHNPFSLETSMDENMDSLFQNHDWNVINSHSCNEILDVEDFLGVRSSENHSDLVPLNDLDHLFTNNSLEVMPMENSLVAATNNGNYEYQENNANNNMQPLTLSTGNDGNKDSTNERSGDNNNTNNDVEVACRNSSQNSRQRKPKYRGVSRHVSTGRYEAHLWDNSVKREGKSKKGYQGKLQINYVFSLFSIKPFLKFWLTHYFFFFWFMFLFIFLLVYLGGYDSEEKAARVYDLVALKYWGESATTNFPIGNYEKELEEMKNITKHDYVAAIRRKSSGFCRGASMYRGVTKHTKNGKWQAKMGRVGGEKDVYLGTYSTEEEAAKAYDIAAIKFRGPTAVTNFDINCYDVKSIIESNTLPLKGGAGKILEDSTEAVESSREREEMTSLLGSSSTSNVQGHGYPLQNQAISSYTKKNKMTQTMVG